MWEVGVPCGMLLIFSKWQIQLSIMTGGWVGHPVVPLRTRHFCLSLGLSQAVDHKKIFQVQLGHVRSFWFSTTGDSCWSCYITAPMKVSNTNPPSSDWASVEQEIAPKEILHPWSVCFSPGQREAIQKSVTRSCLLEDSGEEELSDNGGEEAAEAMEWTSACHKGGYCVQPTYGNRTFYEAVASTVFQTGRLPTRRQVTSPKWRT